MDASKDFIKTIFEYKKDKLTLSMLEEKVNKVYKQQQLYNLRGQLKHQQNKKMKKHQQMIFLRIIQRNYSQCFKKNKDKIKDQKLEREQQQMRKLKK